MGRFKEYVLEEGECWDAVCHGVSTGWKAYKDKRNDQRSKTEVKKLTEKIKDAKNGELKGLIDKIVDKDLTVNKNGEVQEPPQVKHMHKWLTEGRNVRSQRRHDSKEAQEKRFVPRRGIAS